MPDLNFQNFSTVQNALMQKPVTLASATVIAPQTFLTFLSGTTAIATITPPVTGCHMLAISFTAGSPPAVGTGGNILTAIATPTQNQIYFFIYDPVSGKYLNK
jgi:hypothetical protein